MSTPQNSSSQMALPKGKKRKAGVDT